MPPRPVALVTGASSGIGATFARALAGRGYDLILVARRREKLEELARDLETKHGAGTEVIVADLAGDADLDVVARRIAEEPRLALLVNNAGFGTLGRFWEADLEGQDRMHRLHVMATVRLTHAALPGMVARNKGSIVNVSSVAGFAQNPGNTSYAATKCWMNSFTEGLYLELKSARSAVRVQALCPGFTYSEFHDIMGMDRNLIPARLWTTAEYVVEESLRGLKRNKLFVIPGWPYKLLVSLLRFIPRRLFHAGTLRYAQRSRREIRPR